MNVNGVNFVQTGDPNADLVTYAAARGISEAEAKTELQAVFGDPQVPGVNATSADEESVIVGDTETADGEATIVDEVDSSTKNHANDLKNKFSGMFGTTDVNEIYDRYQKLRANFYNADDGGSTNEINARFDVIGGYIGDNRNDVGWWNRWAAKLNDMEADINTMMKYADK